MIKLEISDKVEAFRGEFRAWLKEHSPPPVHEDVSLEAFIDRGRSWQAELAEDRWVGVHWPEEYGGRSLSLVEEAVIQEELVRVNSPQLLGLFGLTMVGPVLIQHGTDEQKKRYLSKILSAEEIWCQGFSEPGAGSDLAAIKTKAKPVEGGFSISGQKIWTSFAQIAHFCFVLCRTSEEEKKHHGLSYLLVDMKEKGIEARALKQISGDEEFNEVFFDEVFTAENNLVGDVGEGWKIAISTLMYERVVLTFARQLQSEVALRQMLKDHAKHPSSTMKVALAKELARAAAVRALAYDHLLHYAEGNRPGPEGSMDKLFWSESFQSIAKLGLAFAGENAAGSELTGDERKAIHRYLYSRGRTIAAGTSEIQRSIIAERVLGLPRLRYSG